MANYVDLLFPLRYSVGFAVIHKFVLPYYHPAELKLKKYASFENISISLIHSFITAISSLFCILYDSSILVNMKTYQSDLALAVVRFSYSYFLYDLYDMLRMNGYNPL